METRVSVIVPVYNVEKYLERCVKSLTDQTLREIQIILVDDGSSDGSGELCRQFAEKDSRIKVISKKMRGRDWQEIPAFHVFRANMLLLWIQMTILIRIRLKFYGIPWKAVELICAVTAM